MESNKKQDKRNINQWTSKLNVKPTNAISNHWSMAIYICKGIMNNRFVGACTMHACIKLLSFDKWHEWSIHDDDDAQAFIIRGQYVAQQLNNSSFTIYIVCFPLLASFIQLLCGYLCTYPFLVQVLSIILLGWDIKSQYINRSF